MDNIAQRRTQPSAIPTLVPRLLYDRKAAAHMLCVSIRSIDYLLARKKLTGRRKGKKVLISHAELVRWASSNDFESFA